ncbi:hypothetical protein [Streptomyces sp. NPDC059701]|uniref:hypothetical protein n=1 Tax=Streptomyces sp. NPDC059701 TaxID=3346914 RepID=UPI0036A7D2C9
MNVRVRRGLSGAATALMLGLSAVSCADSAEQTVPDRICGTRIDPDVTRQIVHPGDAWSEFNRVERAEAVTAPCVLLSDKKPVLDFRFWWTEDKPDLMYLARPESISRVSQPRRVDFAEGAVMGTDGALSTAFCKSSSGKYFTLTLRMPQVTPVDGSHRKDIENFMRVYFPATVKTLRCG